jgi:inner membrane protein
MASIGHIAVGMAAARVDDRRARRPPIAALAIWSAVSLLADLDVIGFSFGVEYGDPWGHRGASHSFAMAVVAGLAATLAARALRRPALRTGLLTTALVASHALLDTMTDGGLGCALFWPFDLTRYFAPWRPIPVAPIGAAFFTPFGASIACIELVMFAPLFAVALWPRGRRVPRLVSGGLAALWAGSMWLIVSTDPVRQGVIGAILREDTVYTSGFSERAFAVIRPAAVSSELVLSPGRPAAPAGDGDGGFGISGRMSHRAVRGGRADVGGQPRAMPRARNRSRDVDDGCRATARRAGGIVLELYLEPGQQTVPRAHGVLRRRHGRNDLPALAVKRRGLSKEPRGLKWKDPDGDGRSRIQRCAHPSA